MKLQTIERNIETSGTLSSADFGISADDQAHVLVILRDKLYSDKFAAIVREITTNAWDAHADAGIADKPIKVQVPTRFEPTFIVRDYGKGLTEKDIYEVYVRYGKSTKRNSNTQIGQLGLGCKSPFAYTNSFNIISYCQGLKTTYVAFIDESGVGKVTKLQEIPSEETGIEIQIAIRATDIEAIRERAQRLFPYFNPMPNCNIKIAPIEYTIKSIATSVLPWAIKATGNSMAIMGNVPYPIEPHKIPELNSSSRELLSCGIDVWFDIGALSVSASRESLEYTDTARKAICQRLDVIRKEILSSLTEEFATIKSIWEARMFLYRISNHYGNYNYRNLIRTLAMNTFTTWNNIPIDLSTFKYTEKVESDLIVRGWFKEKARPTDNTTATWRKTMTISKDLIVIKNDLKTNWLQRVLSWRTKTFAETSVHHDILFLSLQKDSKVSLNDAVEIYLKNNNLTGITVITASSLPLPEEVEKEKSENTISTKVDSKSKYKIFSLVEKFTPNTFPASNNWQPAEVDLEEGEGVYMVIHGFQPYDQDSTKMQNTAKLLNLLHCLSLDVNAHPVYGIRNELVSKVGPKWQDFNTWATAKIVELLKAYPEKEKLIAYYIANNYSFSWHTNFEAQLKSFVTLAEDKEIEQAVEIIKSANTFSLTLDWPQKRAFTTILTELQHDIMLIVAPSLNIIQTIESKYPLLKNSKFFHGTGSPPFEGGDWPSNLATYVKMMNNNNKK